MADQAVRESEYSDEEPEEEDPFSEEDLPENPLHTRKPSATERIFAIVDHDAIADAYTIDCIEAAGPASSGAPAGLIVHFYVHVIEEEALRLIKATCIRTMESAANFTTCGNLSHVGKVAIVTALGGMLNSLSVGTLQQMSEETGHPVAAFAQVFYQAVAACYEAASAFPEGLWTAMKNLSKKMKMRGIQLTDDAQQLMHDWWTELITRKTAPS
jgi:hypothetical protein